MSNQKKRQRDEETSWSSANKRSRVSVAVDIKELCGHVAESLRANDHADADRLIAQAESQLHTLRAEELEVFVKQALEAFKVEAKDNAEMSAQMTADYIRLKELTKSDTFKQGMINDGIEQIAELLMAKHTLEGKLTASMSELAAAHQQLGAEKLRGDQLSSEVATLKSEKAFSQGIMQFLKDEVKKHKDACEQHKAACKDVGKKNFKLQIQLAGHLKTVNEQAAKLAQLPSDDKIAQQLQWHQKQAEEQKAYVRKLEEERARFMEDARRLRQDLEKQSQNESVLRSQKDMAVKEAATLRAKFEDPIIQTLSIAKEPWPKCYMLLQAPYAERVRTGVLCWVGQFKGRSMLPNHWLVQFYDESKENPGTYVKSPGYGITAVLAESSFFCISRLPANRNENTQMLAYLAKVEPIATSRALVAPMKTDVQK